RSGRARVHSRPDRSRHLRALEAALGGSARAQRVARSLPPLPAAAPSAHHAAAAAAAAQRLVQRRRRARARGGLDPRRPRGAAPARQLLHRAERAHAATARHGAARDRAASARRRRVLPPAALRRALDAGSSAIAMNEKLLELARANGILLDYYDIWGQQHHAGEGTL